MLWMIAAFALTVMVPEIGPFWALLITAVLFQGAENLFGNRLRELEAWLQIVKEDLVQKAQSFLHRLSHHA